MKTAIRIFLGFGSIWYQRSKFGPTFSNKYVNFFTFLKLRKLKTSKTQQELRKDFYECFGNLDRLQKKYRSAKRINLRETMHKVQRANVTHY